MHECLEASDRLGIPLPFIGDVQERNIIVVLAHTLEHCGGYRARHAGEWHDIDNARDPVVNVIYGLAHGQDGLSFKGMMDIGRSAPKGLFDARLTQAAKAAVETAQEPSFISMLDMSGHIRL